MQHGPRTSLARALTTGTRRLAPACGLIAITLALICAASPSPLQAHHSFSAEYDAAAPVILQGIVSRLDWTNPHASLFLDVTGADGSVTMWAIELSAPNALARRGFRPDSVVPGAKIIVTGYRAKNGSPVARGWSITFPGGRSLSLGMPGPE